MNAIVGPDSEERIQAESLGDAPDEAPGSLEERYVRHAPEAVRLAYLLTGDAGLAEDLAHEAFIKVAGRFHHLRNPEAFAAYLRKTVVNLSMSHHRRKRVERDHLARESSRPARPRSSHPTWKAATNCGARSGRFRSASGQRSCSATTKTFPSSRSRKRWAVRSPPPAPWCSVPWRPCARRSPEVTTYERPGTATEGRARDGCGEGAHGSSRTGRAQAAGSSSAGRHRARRHGRDRRDPGRVARGVSEPSTGARARPRSMTRGPDTRSSNGPP